ncbi:MAG: GH92 family glycosyl hydrolase, partial [Bacteroidia bacterium]|nr:GH92 family glycosyl hydrolase [Bacteroidia bacterium]
MQKSLLVYCLLLIALLNTIKKCSAQTDLKAYIKPHIGTKGWLFHGRTTPFVAVPFGNTHWTACTAMGRISKVLYHYKHRRILGFRATHKPAMWMGDYGFMQVMPDFENKMPGNLIASARFSHHNEVLQPHYYAVTTHHTHNQKVFTEMSSTATCGFLRFHFSGKENPTLNFRMSNPGNGLGWVKIDTMKQIIFGYNTDRESAHLGPPLPNFKGYFFIRYSQKALAFAYWNQLGDLPGSIECSGDECGVKLVFPLDAKLVEIKVGTSFISLEQAEANLNAEIVSADFEEVKTRSACLWDQHLSSLQIQTNSKKEKEIFYTAMYHSLLFPRKFSEQGRYYSAFDDKVHQGESYNDYSLWDTYRALHPLLLFIAPQHVSGMCNALIQMYREGGYMPKWPNPTYTNIMIGTHADAVLADALVKGVKGIDVKGAYDACMKNAFVPPAGDSVKWWGDRELWPGYEARSGLYWYKKLGYVPVDKTAEAAANTLEGAFDDFCEAQVAGIAGHDSIKQVLEARSKNYRNLFNSQTGFMSPRNADGSWAATKRSGFTEGGPWTYRFAVQHDVPGLIELMGGKEIFVRELRKNFIPLR